MSFRLTADEIEHYERDGYVLRHGVFREAECDEIVDECEALVGDMVARRRHKRHHVGSYTFEMDRETDVTVKWEGDTDVVHGLEPFAHHWPALRDWALDDRFLDVSADILGVEQAVLFTEKLNLKRPFHGGVNPLHQDYPYWTDAADDARRVVTAMLFLDDATLENGTLQVLAGSHREGVAALRTDQDAFGNLEMDPRPHEDAVLVPVEVRRGAVVWFGPFLVHKSDPNRSPKERRTLLYSYVPAGHRHMLEIFHAQRAERAAQSNP